MKLLVFAHTPPPHHGQSYMVQLMLEGFGGNRRKQRRDPPATSPYGIECYHVNARLSRNLSDIGEFRPGKLVLLVRYCLEAIWCRYRHGVDTVYYIPSPGKRSALLRDWIVMTLCRPFFGRIILHWHASGLGKWLETSASMRPRARTYRLIRQADLSIVLSKHGQRDALKWLPRKIAVVANGIPDPCPEFEREVLPRRNLRATIHTAIMNGTQRGETSEKTNSNSPEVVTVLFLGHCTRDKGLFDTLSGVNLAARELASRGSQLSFRLLVAGAFILPNERAEFDRLMMAEDIRKLVTYVGFVSGEQKRKLLKEADIFCFPTFFHNESQPVTLIEAMAYGLTVVTTRWRSVHEVLPHGYPGTVEPKRPDQVARALLAAITQNPAPELRQHFLGHFTEQEHLSNLAAAIHSVETAGDEQGARCHGKTSQMAASH